MGILSVSEKETSAENIDVTMLITACTFLQVRVCNFAVLSQIDSNSVRNFCFYDKKLMSRGNLNRQFQSS